MITCGFGDTVTNFWTVVTERDCLGPYPLTLTLTLRNLIVPML